MHASSHHRRPVLLDRSTSDLDDQIRERLAVQDEATSRLESALEALATNIGQRLEHALDGIPDGQTAIEQALDGLSDSEQVRVAVLAAQLDGRCVTMFFGGKQGGAPGAGV